MPICTALIHLIALHIGSGHYQTFTPGVGFMCEASQVQVAAGIYRNSNGDTSRYVALGSEPLEIGPVRAGAFLGAVDGYRWRYGGHAGPFGGLQASVPMFGGRMRVELVPKPSDRTAVALGVVYQLQEW